MHKQLFIGIVKKVVDNQNYKIVLQDESEILATLSSKVKLNMSYEIQEGEEVAVELSPYDKTRGRISYKHSVMNKYWNRRE
jgi:translation initiation factor IF-1